jgi:hypothetical protein
LSAVGWRKALRRKQLGKTWREKSRKMSVCEDLAVGTRFDLVNKLHNLHSDFGRSSDRKSLLHLHLG